MRYERYRKTGIPWLPEVPEEWEVHRVRNHYTVVSGSGFSPEIQGNAEGDFPVCKASDISNAGKELRTAANWISSEVAKQVGFHIMPLGSLLFPKIGEAMRKNSRAIAMVDCCADNNCQCLVPHNIDSGYTYYLFTQIDMNWFDNAGPVPCLSNKKLLGFSIPFPPLPTQRAIVAFLDEKCGKVDRLVAAKQKEVSLLKELKQSIIADAVTGRRGTGNGERGMGESCAETQSRRGKTKPSGIAWLPEVPEGWEVRRAASFLKVKDAPSAPEEELLSVFLDRGVIRFSEGGEKRANATSKDLSKYQLVEPDDFVMNNQQAWRGSVGVSPYRGIVSPAYFVVQLGDCIDPKYANIAFRSKPFVSVFELCSRGVGSIQRNLIWNMFKQQHLPLPPLPEQREIVAYIEAKTAKIGAAVAGLEREIAALKEFKQRLIADVVTGQRRVA